MIARELRKNSSETQELPHLQSQKFYVALLDIDLKIIDIGLKTNQNFSFSSLQSPNFMLDYHYAQILARADHKT